MRWVFLGVLLAFGKGRLIADLLHHRPALIAVLGIGAAASVLRPRPIAFAAFVAPLLAFVVAPKSTTVGLGIGWGAFIILVAAFVGIGTALRLRDRRGSAAE